MNIVFFGSGGFAVPVLRRLVRDGAPHTLREVVTRPARPAGRGKRLRQTPVEVEAVVAGLPHSAPPTVNAPEFLEHLATLEPDVFVVVDYGEFLRKPFRELPRIGAYNLHASLLPAYRGAAPIAYAVLQRESETGVTLFRIERELDSGPIVDVIRTPVDPDETAGELEERLAPLGADLLMRNLDAFADGTFTETPQCEEDVTLAPKLRKEESLIDWNRDAQVIAAGVRGYNPWPGAYSFLLGAKSPERTVFVRANASEDQVTERSPGEVQAATSEGFTIRCGTGSLEVIELQRAGKAALSAAEYLRGRRLEPGARFGPG